MTPLPGRRRPRPVPAIPALIWVITLLHLTVMLAQTAVFPNVRSPDEMKHVDLMIQVEQGTAWPWPGPGTLLVTDGVNAGRFLTADTLYTGAQHLADRVEDADAAAPDAVPPRGARPTYDDAGGRAPWIPERTDGSTDPVHNQLVQHPPLYYLLGAAALHAVPDWTALPLDQVWMGLRLLNILLAAPLPILLWASARRMRLPEPLPAAAALAPIAVPEMAHLFSAVNNDNLLVLLGTALVYLLVRVMTGDLSRRTALLIGFVTTAALLTKGFALMFPLWVAAAYAAAAFRAPGRRKDAAGPLGIAAVAMLPGALWWVRNLVLYGAIQPHGTHREVPELPAVYGWSDGGMRWLGRLLERFTTTFFVQDHAAARAHDVSWWSARVALALLLIGIVMALVRHTVPRTTAVVLLIATPLLGAIVARGSWEQFAAYQDFSAAQQGRYLYTGFAGVVLVALAGAALLRPAWRRRLPHGILALALGMHAAFWFDTWNLYWMPATGTDDVVEPGDVARAAQAIMYWYPWNGWLLAVVVGIGAAAATAVILLTARPARTARQIDVPDQLQPGTPT